MSCFSFDARAARITWTILVILGGFGLIYAMRRVVILVALSLFFAYLLFPLVRLAQRWLLPTRSLAIAAVYVVILAAFGGAGVVIGPRLTTEAQSLAERLPDMSKQIQSGEIVGNLLGRTAGSRARSPISSACCERTRDRSSTTRSRLGHDS